MNYLSLLAFAVVLGLAPVTVYARNGNDMTMRGGKFKTTEDLKQALMSHLQLSNNPEKIQRQRFDYVYELIKANVPLYREFNPNDRYTIEYAVNSILTNVQRFIEQLPNGWADFKRQYNLLQDIQAFLKNQQLAYYDITFTGTEKSPRRYLEVPGRYEPEMMPTGNPRRMMRMGSDMEM